MFQIFILSLLLISSPTNRSVCVVHVCQYQWGFQNCKQYIENYVLQTGYTLYQNYNTISIHIRKQNTAKWLDTIYMWHDMYVCILSFEPLLSSISRFNILIMTTKPVTGKGLHCDVRMCICFRCTNSNCSALLRTDTECTTLFNSRNIHNHNEICWQKLARDVFHKGCKCKRFGVNSSNLLCPCFASTSFTEQTSDNQFFSA